jgi:hypothetical protein
MLKMRAVDKLDLASRIGRELQSRFTFAEIDQFLRSHRIAPGAVTVNSKWVYSREQVSQAPDEIVLKIADELEVIPSTGGKAVWLPPRNWKDTKQFRLFISHISENKDRATRLRDCLVPFAVSGFVAHEDIVPTLEWQSEIERALQTMEAFVAIHTPGFSKSNWTQQEVGFAVGRRVPIISLQMGELPTGFLLKNQALARRGRTADQVAAEIDQLLTSDPRTVDRLREAKNHFSSDKMDDDVPF